MNLDLVQKFDLTEQQLKDWGCKYHDLILGKPHADFFIDDKGIKQSYISVKSK